MIVNECIKRLHSKNSARTKTSNDLIRLINETDLLRIPTNSIQRFIRVLDTVPVKESINASPFQT
jgi:hypothetical protein